MGEGSEKQMSESFAIAILLALVGGYLDAYTYVCRDQVFANAQTGNIVKVGIAIANGDYLETIKYVIPIIAFSSGVMLAMVIRSCYLNRTRLHWRQVILLIEIGVMLAAGWIPVGKFNIIVNIMVSFICAMQVECFRKVLGKPFASTMCTGNLRSGTEYLYQAICCRDKKAMKSCIHYGSIILTFILGAALGVWLTSAMLERAILACIIPMVLALCLMFKKTEA